MMTLLCVCVCVRAHVCVRVCLQGDAVVCQWLITSSPPTNLQTWVTASHYQPIRARDLVCVCVCVCVVSFIKDCFQCVCALVNTHTDDCVDALMRTSWSIFNPSAAFLLLLPHIFTLRGARFCRFCLWVQLQLEVRWRRTYCSGSSLLLWFYSPDLSVTLELLFQNKSTMLTVIQNAFAAETKLSSSFLTVTFIIIIIIIVCVCVRLWCSCQHSLLPTDTWAEKCQIQ